MSLAQNLADAAARDGGRVAIKLDGVEVSYRALDEASARVAKLLCDRGVRPGDRVGVMLPNVPYFPIACYGILRAGGVVPMNVLFKSRETGFYLSDPEAKAVFAWQDFAEAAQAGADVAGAECIVVKPGDFEHLLGSVQDPSEGVEPRADGDTAVILYTSGTTGKPKGAELTHGNLSKNADVALGLFGLTAEDVIFGGLPLFHSFGQTCGMNAAIAAGACLTLVPRFEPAKVLDVIGRDKVTVFEGVPTMYGALLNDPAAESTDTSTLRLCASGGASLPVELLKAFEERFGCKILEGYGLSETSPIASFNHADRERKAGSIGTPTQASR
jgi:long-chain acyl-CoA synthetase